MATKDTGGQRQASKRTEDTEEAEPQASGEVKERQENELVNNENYGLLHNVHASMRMSTRGGAPTRTGPA